MTTKPAVTEKPSRVRKPKAVEAPAETFVAFKGFNSDLTCNGGDKPFQYEIGQTYEHKGRVVQCASGFHACQSPLDVLDYYPLVAADGALNRFARVTLGGKNDRSDDKKWVAAELTVDVELTIPEFIKSAVEWIMSAAKAGNVVSKRGGDKLAASGYSSQLAASGDSSQLAASGNASQLEITGGKSAAAAVGPGSIVKAVAGTPVAICEYDSDGSPIGFATGIAGQDGVPTDTWLIAKSGKLVAVS